ncbi:S8 family serine peptidase [Phytomonospora sp. NPDC050363]|uniref:S8 family serine peptidase n=1 Tax=Phytomonospora sp. NPDC050363 TaxID=3155642 RepID=UPI0033D4D373
MTESTPHAPEPEGRLEPAPPPPPTAVGTLDPPPPPAAPPERPSTWGPLAAIYAVLAGVWVLTWTFVLQTGAWVWWQLQASGDEPVSAGLWTLVAIANAIMAATAILPMLFMRRWPRLFVTAGAWLSAVAVLLVMAATRLIPGVANEILLGAQGVGALLLAAIAWAVRRRRDADADAEEDKAGGGQWWALVAGGVTLLPWLWSGGLGSLWETLAAAVAATGLAALAGTVLGRRFWAPFTQGGGWRLMLGGGTAAGVALYVLGSAFGGTGVQIPLMVLLSALGFAVAALQRGPRFAGRVVACAVGPAAFGPLAFIDSDEFLPLVLGPEDFGKWSGIALLIAVLAAWVVAGVYIALSRRLLELPAVGAAVSVLVLATACAVYFTGSPGFTGERVVVVLSTQADLSGVSEIADRDERLTETHRRLVAHAEESQASLRSELDDRGIAYTPYYLVNAIEIDEGLDARLWLDDRDDVSAVLLSPQLRPVPEAAPVMSGSDESVAAAQPNISLIGADKAWESGVDGSGITIGISDSGVDGSHPALENGFRGGDDSWLDPDGGTTTPNDPNGHGTHALGLALGDDGIGVAPGASWIGCMNLPRNLGNPADYIACMQFMLAPYGPGEDPFTAGDPTRAPHVLTNSWGCPQIEGCDESVLGPGVDALTAAGIFVVVAAGNSGPACESASTPPARYDGAYTVGAVDNAAKVAGFSSRGPISGTGAAKPDIAAPGVEVVSSLPGGGYGPLSGTSMATPHVAGVVALLWQANPELIGDIAGTEAILASTATPATGALDLLDEEVPNGLDACGGAKNLVGAGVINAFAAVEAARG